MKAVALFTFVTIAFVGCKEARVDAMIVFRDASHTGAEAFVIKALPDLLCQTFSLEQAPLSGLVQTSEEWILRGRSESAIHDVQVVALGYEGKLSVFIDSPSLASEADEIVAIREFIVDRANDLVVSVSP